MLVVRCYRGRARLAVLMGTLAVLAGCTGAPRGPRLDFGGDCPIGVEGLPGEVKTVQLSFWNIGDQPLQIQSVRTTCGCSVASVEPDRLDPQEKGTLTLRVTIPPGGRAGQILIGTNASGQEVVELRFLAQAIDPVQFSSRRARLEVSSAGTGNASVRIRPRAGLKDVYRPRSVEVDSVTVGGLAAEVEELSEGWALRLSYRGKPPEIPRTGFVWVRVDTAAGSCTTPVEVTVDNDLPVLLVPARVLIRRDGPVEGGERRIAQAFAVAKGEELPDLASCTAPAPLRIRYEPTARRRASIRVTVPERDIGRLDGLAWPVRVRLEFSDGRWLTLVLLDQSPGVPGHASERRTLTLAGEVEEP